ncbi:hypothetical protein [Stieleria sp.]|uniref:hypothetical protein n=1 Tax=Stieleria sp. TaxID=2795976 RepID=UPI0035646DD3
MTLLLLLALTIPTETPSIHFDRIDINHCHQPDGTLAFTQLIFWRWSRFERRFISYGYVMLRDKQQRPVCCGDRHSVIVNHDGKRWRVTSDCVIETWTVGDPEAEDRKKYPEFRRDGE